MATTFTTSKTQAGAQPRAGIDLTAVSATYTLAAALVINDVIQMVMVPKGATIVDVCVSCPDLDSGATMLIEVGDGVDTDRFITSSNIGQAGGLARLNAHTGNGYTYTADDTIDVKVATAGTGGAAGTIVLTATYQMQQ